MVRCNWIHQVCCDQPAVSDTDGSQDQVYYQLQNRHAMDFDVSAGSIID